MITINIKEAQHPLKREKQVIDKSSIMLKISTKSMQPIGVQTQVDSFKDIEYLPTSVIQDRAPIAFEIGKDEELYTNATNL